MKRKRIEKLVVLWGTTLAVILILYSFGLHFVKKPLELKYEIMYLYDISLISVKQETNAHRSYITFMNLAENENENLEVISEKLYEDLGFLRIHESTSKSLNILHKNSDNIDLPSSSKSTTLYKTYIEYLDSVYHLNDLLIDMQDMTYEEYKEEYLKRLQECSRLQTELDMIFSQKTIFGF